MLSWGHDEYLYNVVKHQSKIPDEGLAMIRYHSFYPWHKEGAYYKLMNDHDMEMLKAVKAFNPYDLYSKSDEIPMVEELRVSLGIFYFHLNANLLTILLSLKPYYVDLIDEFFPEKIIEW